ncbi:uncharacterized protein [Argopecten irradians]|uniref:uncharacterized protein isoform X1 n=1 Tax=Argopecten irradians TaxID=31199 RepID=UPI0037215F0C
MAIRKREKTSAKIIANLKASLNRLKRDQSKTGRKAYQILTRSVCGKAVVEHSVRKTLEVKFEYWQICCLLNVEEEPEMSRSNAMKCEERDRLEDFYKQEATTLASKKTVNLKTGEQKSIMMETIPRTYAKFITKFPGTKLSLSHFRKLRPKSVLTMKHMKFINCLCEYCLNVKFKIDVIDKLLEKAGHSQHKLKSKEEAVQHTICQKGDGEFPKFECISRQCRQRSPHSIRVHLEVLDANQECCWKRWELSSIEKVANGKVQVSKRQVLLEKTGLLQELLAEFVMELGPLGEHLFTAQWQKEQFSKLTTAVQEKCVVTVADFAENYRCPMQDEIQSAHYSYNQVTIYPVVAYYSCPEKHCKEIVKESIIHISDDVVHDFEAVSTFTSRTESHLKENGIDFTNHIEFSDGCASQFKGKNTFFSVSNTENLERAYFGSRHGKSPSDALGGFVKRSAEGFVKSRAGFIRNGKEFHDFCSSNLKKDITKCKDGKHSHSRSVFFYYDEIRRNASSRNTVKTLKGTRKLHSVRGVKPGVVESRNLSCFCGVCLGKKTGSCPNSKYVKQWTPHIILETKNNKPLREKEGQKKMKKKNKQTKITHDGKKKTKTH